MHGICATAFEKVRKAFLANFTEMGEVGARVTIYQGEDKVVDLWGGFTDEEQTKPWQEDTLVNTMSISKGVAAFAAHILADRGLMDYEKPVATYWPEFSQGGKEKMTVRQVLGHQASLLFIDEAVPGDALDFDVFAGKIARQAPNWKPGTRCAYHSITIGFLVGTLIKRIDGRPIAQFIREEITGPLGTDYILGAEDKDIGRIAPTIFNPKNEVMGGQLVNEKTMKIFSALPEDPIFFNSPTHWKSVNPSTSGVTHAEAIAKIFAPLANGGRFGNRQYIKPSTIEAMSEVQWHDNDSVFGWEFCSTMGLLRHTETNYYGREGNFGAAGAGGFTGFADPVNRISFGYTPVRMTSGAGLGEESRRLVDALYSCL